MNAGGKRSLKSFQWLHARTTGTIRTAVASTRYAQTRRKKNIRAKYQNSKAYVLEYIISTVNPSPSRLSAGKSLGIKPEPQARVLYCLSFFSADKRSGSGIYCIHTASGSPDTAQQLPCLLVAVLNVLNGLLRNAWGCSCLCREQRMKLPKSDHA